MYECFFSKMIVLGQLYVSVGTRTATSISLSWSVPSDSVMTRYEVTWQRVGCPDDEDEGSITLGSRSNYKMRGLEEDSRYTITVTAFYSDKIGSVSNTVTAMTLEAGIRELNIGLLYFLFPQ